MAMTISGCGKENESGGGDSKNTDWYGSNENDPTNLGNYDRIRDYYEGYPLNSRLYLNMVIYHIGPAYGGDDLYNNYEYDFDFDVSFCGYFLFWEVGDCSSSYNQYASNQYQGTVERGAYRVVTHYNAEKVTLNEANGYTDYDFNFTNSSFTRSNDLYRRMLNLDGKAVDRVVISKAKLHVTKRDRNGNNPKNESFDADYVEYFFADKTVEGYVLSTRMPLAANPVAITYKRNYQDDYYTPRRPEVDGKLLVAGEYTINRIEVDVHTVSASAFTGTYKIQSKKLGRIEL